MYDMGILKYGLLVGVTAMIVKLWPSVYHDNLPLHFGGWVKNSSFAPIEETFRKNFNGYDEKEGAAFAVYYKGELVVDIWGGYADSSAYREWKENTITVVYSISKAVCGICAGILMDRGLLDPDALVTKYWPQFGANGKENVTVAMLLAHQAGLAFIDSPILMSEAYDWHIMSKKFEDQVPNWPPGTRYGYHALTYGWLVDQLIRRVDPKGRSVGQFFREEIAIPYDIDFYIGLPPEELYRVARIVFPNGLDYVKAWTEYATMYELAAYYTAPNDFKSRVLKNPYWLLWQGRNGFNNPEVLAMEIGSGNGVGNARGVAKIFTLMNNGKLFKSDNFLDRVYHHPVLDNPRDIVVNVPMIYTFGFMVTKSPEGENHIGFSGYGGQNVRLDRKHDLVFAYVTNGLQPGMGDLGKNFLKLEEATYRSIGVAKSYRSFPFNVPPYI